MLNVLRTMLGVAAAVLYCGPAAAQRPAPEYVPGNTVVCVLPVINKSGEKSAKQNADQAIKAHDRIVALFKERGFIVSPEAAGTDAIKRLDVDIQDEENYNRATLYKIGAEAKADLMVFAVITNVEQAIERRWTGERKQGRATVKMWLLDVKEKKAILSAVSKEASAEGIVGWQKGSKQIRDAASRAAGNALSDFLEKYPKK